jgi:predicted GIY-YIG superfamily endonuclease
MQLYYVHILQSKKSPSNYYTSFTEDVEKRLKAHNDGQALHTKKHKPWVLKTAILFINKQKALRFEKYLKTASGRAFAKKRF